MAESLVLWMSGSAVILGVIFLLLLFILALSPPRRKNDPRMKENYESERKSDVDKDLKKIKEQISGDEEVW